MLWYEAGFGFRDIPTPLDARGYIIRYRIEKNQLF